MKTVRAFDILDYYDGIEIFAARDERGENYLGLRVDTSGDHDRYAVVGVRPERLREFRSGKLDLRELMLEAPKGEWYVTVASVAFGQPMPLELQDTPLELSDDVLPSPGFTLDAELPDGHPLMERYPPDDASSAYQEHSQYGRYTVALAQKFAEYCINAANFAGGIDSLTVGELQVALHSVETAFSRANSNYNYRSARNAAQNLSEQNERLQGHMYFKYIRENDANRDRYSQSHAAMSVMKTLHEKTDDLLRMAVNSNMPSHLRSVQTEMCWHILELCERGAGVIAGASQAYPQMLTQPAVMNSEKDMSKGYDVFMSYASEDRETIARPLTEALEMQGLRVWFDNQRILIRDNIRQKIEEGLAESRYGVVILSNSFISEAKSWTRFEFNALIESALPVYHEVGQQEVSNQFPALAGISALETSEHDIAYIANEIYRNIPGNDDRGIAQAAQQPIQQDSGFAAFYVASAHTEELVGEKERAFDFGMNPRRWFSLVDDDGELAYRITGNTLRIRLNYGNQWSGDELDANLLISRNEPFELTMHPTGLNQRYFPGVIKTSPPNGVFMQSNRSGWMTFEIQ